MPEFNTIPDEWTKARGQASVEGPGGGGKAFSVCGWQTSAQMGETLQTCFLQCGVSKSGPHASISNPWELPGSADSQAPPQVL